MNLIGKIRGGDMVPKHRAAPRHESNRNGTVRRALSVGVRKTTPHEPRPQEWSPPPVYLAGSAARGGRLSVRRPHRFRQIASAPNFQPRPHQPLAIVGLELRLGFFERCSAPVGPDAGLMCADHNDGPEPAQLRRVVRVLMHPSNFAAVVNDDVVPSIGVWRPRPVWRRERRIVNSGATDLNG
jgi:hypothetical protein